jgi:copper homeostasis protein (lipoprotein)
VLIRVQSIVDGFVAKKMIHLFILSRSFMKKLISIATLVIAVSLLNSCDNNSRDETSASKNISADSSLSPTDSPAVLTDQHTSANSVDWFGTYKGVLPCADCKGIETEIILNKDHTYSIKTTHLGKTDQPLEEKGNMSWNQAGNTITLTGVKDKPSQYFVGENRITQLDLGGHKITGALADKYVLVKQQATAVASTQPGNAKLQETYWRLTEIMGKPVGSREMHIMLKKDSTFQGFAGCNNLTGQYELKDGNRISFKKIAATLKACPNMETEEALKNVLEQTDNYSIRANNLSLNKARMAPLARFEGASPK